MIDIVDVGMVEFRLAVGDRAASNFALGIVLRDSGLGSIRVDERAQLSLVEAFELTKLSKDVLGFVRAKLLECAKDLVGPEIGAAEQVESALGITGVRFPNRP